MSRVRQVIGVGGVVSVGGVVVFLWGEERINPSKNKEEEPDVVSARVYERKLSGLRSIMIYRGGRQASRTGRGWG